jgi:hypothetical protein
MKKTSDKKEVVLGKTASKLNEASLKILLRAKAKKGNK